MKKRCTRILCMIVCAALLIVGCAKNPGADKALADGAYDVFVTLSGGSGRATVESPAKLEVRDGEMRATITWSSPNYDYMIVDGEKYLPVNEEGNSVFEIPVAALDTEIVVTADTTAMSKAHEIEYTIRFSLTEEAGGGEEEETGAQETDGELRAPEIPGHPVVAETERAYAEGFRIFQYEGGYEAVCVKNGGSYVLVPEGETAPEGLDPKLAVIQKPVRNIYLAATAAMALFARLDAIPDVRLSGTRSSGWYVPEAKAAMEAGEMLYAGKYSEPDYELLTKENCGLAVESTMILHAPKVKEMIEELGIPVFVDRSSYEKKAMGRTEWIKVYGALLDREEEASRFFADQMDALEAIPPYDGEKKTVAFFYISEAGTAVVRSSSDYIADMIEEAGGDYLAPETALDTKSSGINLSMEEFYAVCADADYLIYNAAVQDEITSVKELMERSPLLGEFRAVREGHVWCAGKNMYQMTDITGEFIADVHRMLSGEDASAMTFLKPVR